MSPGLIPVLSAPMSLPLVPSKLITISRRQPGASGSAHLPAHLEGAVEAAEAASEEAKLRPSRRRRGTTP